MKTYFEWAALGRLPEQSFFFRTYDLYALEKRLKPPIHDSLHWSRRFEYPWVLGRIDSLLKKPAGILDVGAGATALQFWLVELGYGPVTMIDPDRSAVDWVRKRAGTKNFAHEGGLPKLPYETGQFDLALCISVLEHLPKDQVLPSIQELLRVAKKGVIVTMDVCLSTHPGQVDMRDFTELLKALGLDPFVVHPHDLLRFSLDGRTFAVACLHVTKD